MINWKQGDGFNHFGGPGGELAPWWNIQGDYGSNGWFHVYAFTMTMGMLFAIGYSAWKFYRKDISLAQLALGVIIIVPISLFGASFFGKLNAIAPGDNAGHVGFWGLFAFWEPGMAIHGGVYAGTIAGLITFGIMGRKTHVSLWTYMDCIIPNILLGQGIGRWGNFFNHEVVGSPIGIVGKWDGIKATFDNQWGFLHGLPHYIKQNTQFLYDGSEPLKVNGLTITSGDIVQMDPIFFYESISLLIAWFLITFVMPNIGKWFGPKPWKRMKNDFKFSWAATFKNIFAFWLVPSFNKLDKETNAIYESGKTPSYKSQPWWAQSGLVIWKQAYEYNPNIKEKAIFEKEQSKIDSKNYNKTKMRYLKGRALLKANNPEGYAVTKVGAEASAYFFFWNLVRFALELQRPDDHLFIMYEKGLSLGLIAATGILGLLGIVLTQTIIPLFFRQPGYQYEKQFFLAEPIDKKWKIEKKAKVSKSRKVSTKKELTKEEKAKSKLKKIQAKQK